MDTLLINITPCRAIQRTGMASGLVLPFMSLVIAVLSLFLFKHKHDPDEIKNIHGEPVFPTE